MHVDDKVNVAPERGVVVPFIYFCTEKLPFKVHFITVIINNT